MFHKSLFIISSSRRMRNGQRIGFTLYRFQFTFRYSVYFTFMRLLINSLWTVVPRHEIYDSYYIV